MIIAPVPASLIARAHRLDADFYIGRRAEARVEKARRAVAVARRRYAAAVRRLKRRDAQRKALGIAIQLNTENVP